MAIHSESPAKDMVRRMLLDVCLEQLGRSDITYLGMPSDDALDISALRSVVRNVICVEEKKAVLDNARRAIASFSLYQRRFEQMEMWSYLRDKYPSESLLADVAFLDFYGGGLRKEDAFSEEIAGLRSYFAKHARVKDRVFVLAWTYMPRDKGMKKWRDELGKMIVTPTDRHFLLEAKGVTGRSVAIMLLVKHIVAEHGMQALVYHHARYKSVMNALIVCFCRGTDPNFGGSLGTPDTLLEEPVWEYGSEGVVPTRIPLFDLRD